MRLRCVVEGMCLSIALCRCVLNVVHSVSTSAPELYCWLISCVRESMSAFNSVQFADVNL